jgi:peptidoglycan hydrolase CwlO-like protein
VAGGVETSSGSPARVPVIRSFATALAVVALVIGCTFLGLTVKTVLQHDRLAEGLASLRDETSLFKSQQQESLDKIERALVQFAATEGKVEARLQTITDAQGKLESQLGALEASQAAEAAQRQEDVSGIEKATREGFAEVAARLDSEEALAASVEKLLPLQQQPSDSTSPAQTQTPSETPPAS